MILAIVANLIKSQGVRQSALMVVGNTMALGMSALAMILLSRMLGPVGFGEFSVGFSIVLILSRISDLGLTNAQLKFVPVSEESKQKNNIFSLAIQLKLLIGLALMLVGWLITPWLAEVLSFQKPAILYVSFAANLVTVLFEQLAAMLQSLQRFKESVITNALQAGTKLTFAILLFAAGLSDSALAFTLYVSGPITALLVAKKLMPEWWRLKLLRRYKSEEKLIKSMASHAAIGFITAGLIENVDILFVQGFLNEYETGLMSGASRISTLLVSVFGYSLANVLNPRVARYVDYQNLKIYLKKAWLVVLACVVGLAVSVFVSPLLIKITIGEAYLPATYIMQLLMVSSFLTIASVPFIAMFFSFKHAEWYFSVSGVLQLAIMVAGNVLFVPQYGLEAAAMTRVVTKLVLFGFTVGVAQILVVKLKNNKENI